MNRHIDPSARKLKFAIPVGLCLLALFVVLGAQAPPRYLFDPGWPKPLPNKWKIGGVTGLAVDRDDNVWVLQPSQRPDESSSSTPSRIRRLPIAARCRRR